MLTADEKDRVLTLVKGLASSPEVSTSGLMAFMAALPARGEALDLARAELAKLRPELVFEMDGLVIRLRELLSAPRDAAWEERPAVPQSSLEILLATPGPHAPKVDALLAVVRATDRTALPVVKARLPIEDNPFVLATLASALGQLGERADASLLLPLLDSSDSRVVSNTLDALNRLEAEAPVAQVRELVHAADHRLRLSALALFARTDPVSALLVLPPLIGENHPTLTAGIALLLGDLHAQPLATDLLLEMVASEDRPQIVKHVADALKRHAEVAPERIPEVVERLTTTRQAARLHKVPILTALLEALGVKGLAPVFAETTNIVSKAEEPVAEPETPPGHVITNSRIQPRPAGLMASAQTSGLRARPEGLSAPASVSGMRKRDPSVQRPASLMPESAPAEDAAGPIRPWMWLAGAAVGLVVVVGMVMSGPATPKVTTTLPPASAPSRPAPSYNAVPIPPRPPPPPGSGPLGRAASKTLGPSGAELTVEGTVVSIATNRAVIRSGDTLFSCRGKGVSEMKVGDPVKVRGRLAGVARDGMVLVTVDRA